MRQETALGAPSRGRENPTNLGFDPLGAGHSTSHDSVPWTLMIPPVSILSLTQSLESLSEALPWYECDVPTACPRKWGLSQ